MEGEFKMPIPLRKVSSAEYSHEQLDSDAGSEVNPNNVINLPIKSELFVPFESIEDAKAGFIFSKLEMISKYYKSVSGNIFKTKDPILDLASQAFLLYGIKIQIIYQDRQCFGMAVRGIKDFEKLYDCIKDLIWILLYFPCNLISKLSLTLSICQDIEKQNSAISIRDIGLYEGIVISRHYKSPEKLQKHLLKILFVHLMKKSSEKMNVSLVNKEGCKYSPQISGTSTRVQDLYEVFNDLVFSSGDAALNHVQDSVDLEKVKLAINSFL